MARDSMRMRMNTEREKLLAQANEHSRYDSDSEVIEQALRHYVESVEQMKSSDLKRQLTAEQADLISTSEVSLNFYPQVRS